MRTKPLRSGLGFFAFAVGISLVNVLVFPLRAENYGYGLIGLGLTYAAALALMLAGRAVSRMRADKAERAARASPRRFLLCCCSAPFTCWMGYLEYTPSGDYLHALQELADTGHGAAILIIYPYFYLYLAAFPISGAFTRR